MKKISDNYIGTYLFIFQRVAYSEILGMINTCIPIL